MKKYFLLTALCSVAVFFAACSGEEIETPQNLVPAQAFIPGAAANECPDEVLVLTASAAGATSYQWYDETGIIAGETTATYTATVSGGYSVVGVNEAGEGEKSKVKNVTIVRCTPPEQATVSGSTSNTCPATTVVLTAAATDALYYEWYRNNSRISGVTAATYTATASGSYTVAGVNAGGAGERSNAHRVTISACTYSRSNLTGEFTMGWDNLHPSAYGEPVRHTVTLSTGTGSTRLLIRGLIGPNDIQATWTNGTQRLTIALPQNAGSIVADITYPDNRYVAFTTTDDAAPNTGSVTLTGTLTAEYENGAYYLVIRFDYALGLAIFWDGAFAAWFYEGIPGTLFLRKTAPIG
jgi:hypothetical protein